MYRQYLFLASIKNAITNYSLHFWFFFPNNSLYCFQILHHMTLTFDSLQKCDLEIFPCLFGQNFITPIWDNHCFLVSPPVSISTFLRVLCSILSYHMWKMSEPTSTCSGLESTEISDYVKILLITVSWEDNRYQAAVKSSFPSSSTSFFSNV